MKRMFFCLVFLFSLFVSSPSYSYDYWDQVNAPIIIHVASGESNDSTAIASKNVEEVKPQEVVTPEATTAVMEEDTDAAPRPSAKDYEY